MIDFTMFHSGRAGEPANAYYRNAVIIRNAEDLRNVCRFDHVCAEFGNDFHRCKEDFIRCFAVAGDCDNDDTEDPAAWLDPSIVAERAPGVMFYYCASRNNGKTKHPGEKGEKGPRPRYHYYFVLKNPITDHEEARKVYNLLLVLFPEFDANGCKPAQFFFGHNDPVTGMVNGEIDLVEFFAAHPEITITEPAAAADPEEEPQRVQRAANQDDFISMNAPDMLAVIPADDYGTWIDIGMALKAAGQDVSLWDSWSQKSTKYPGHREIEKRWNSFRSSGKGPGTLVHYAKENGWRPDPDKLTGEAKQNHERKVYQEEQLRIFQEEHREKNAAALAAVGIDCGGDPYRFAWKRNFDGLITEVMDKETGEIVYKAPAADPEQPVPGETVHTGPGASDPQKDKPHLTVSGYEDVEIKPIDFMFFPWFPRGYITAIQGDSGSSKSTFMYAIGAAVSTGADLLGVPCEDPGNVMFITLEDDASDIKVAFQDAGGDLSKLFRIREREEIAKINLSPAGVKMLDKIVKENNIKLLVLDPIQQFLENDINKASDTRPQMARLMNIAAENNICVVIIEHLGKDASKSAQHRALGSVDINASTRSQLQVVTDPEDNFFKILFTVKSNLAAFQDVQRAIRYQVKDHPGSYDTEKKKRARFRGHAEFTGIIPEYNERLYKKAQRKADEEAEEEILLAFEYEKDPLVLTVREIVAQNPQGVFIGTDDLIQRITQVCGRCPYDQTKSKATGIYARIDKLRSMIIDNDGIQVDKQGNSIYPKAYQWRGELVEPAHTRTRGFVITPVTAAKQGFQQTKI